MKKKINTMSNICYKGNNRNAVKSPTVTILTAFASTLLHLSITQKPHQQRALDYFLTFIKAVI